MKTFTDRGIIQEISWRLVFHLFQQFHSLNQKELLNLEWLKYFQILAILIRQLLKT